ncbi:MAG TPA: DUF4252 domain-containing protein [Bryobacteraceae bacterium]|nr:DUF4252 domain-containing protein [Bryobacteraceae bacterium]
MRAASAIAIAMILSAPFAVAQKLNLQFDSLAARAKEKAEVDLDGAMLSQAAKMDKKLGELAGAVKEVHVRHYEFGAAGAYSEADLEPLHKQTGAGSGWSRVVNVKDKDDHVEILAHFLDGKPAGLLVIAAEAKELSVVHIVGEIPLDKMSELVNSSIKYDMKGVLAQQKTGGPEPAPQPQN